MKKILLISNYVFHYRQKVYSYFYGAFQKEGYEFHVLSNSYQESGFKIGFIKHERPFSVTGYATEIKKIQPDCVIFFLHLKDWIMIPMIYYCKYKKIPVIYWNWGVSAKTPNSRVKNILFFHIHNISDAIVTYTPETKENYFQEKTKHKVFVGYNTLNFSDIDKDKVPLKKTIKKKYEIIEEFILLFVGRILPDKRLDILLENFQNLDDVAVVIVGSGLSQRQQQVINETKNYYFLGELFGNDVNNIFNSCDVFCMPGAIGLAMNEALFWGKPVCTLTGSSKPEKYFLKNGFNGYIIQNEKDYRKIVLSLLENRILLTEMSKNALEVYEKEAKIDHMFSGFLDAVHFAELSLSEKK
ncbi:MAG: glycosyltransferase family 4 protein [Flexilinea sp.]